MKESTKLLFEEESLARLLDDRLIYKLNLISIYCKKIRKKEIISTANGLIIIIYIVWIF